MATMTSSSDYTNAHAERGILNTLEEGLLLDYWRPSTTNQFQFLQVEFFAVMEVRGVTLKSHSDVTTFMLFYEDLTEMFTSVVDSATNEPKVGV